MPAWILWLSPVIVAPVLAVLWVTWAARPKGPEEARETVQRYDRFRAALTERAPTTELPSVSGRADDQPTHRAG
ncbi:MAG TPA: hypothetical protein VMZ11_05325 [Mycobacteriales bacterium]|nr:hypothetical protein [Mycobacteriales bacterium]